MKKVTILIPTLGTREIEVKRLLDSLVNQTYKNLEIVMVSQDNKEKVEQLCCDYNDIMQIKHVFCEKKGLSIARNYGMNFVNGEIVVLSDDDCWYPDYALEKIVESFEKYSCDIAITQIYDFDNQKLYKQYLTKPKRLKTFDLMSISSIEISFQKNKVKAMFSENLGLGTSLVCGEEVDFMLNNKDRYIQYIPEVTVYHPQKNIKNPQRIIAKGYVYGKHFNFMIGLMICCRDLLVKKENNFKEFIKGFKIGVKDRKK